MEIIFILATRVAAGSATQVSHTKFVNVHSSSNGGSICIDDGISSLSVSFCLFYNSSSSLSGGAMYFNGTEISCTSTCISKCHSTGRCFSIYVQSTVVSFNFVCISQAYNEASLYISYNCIVQGEAVNYKYINISRNYADGSVSATNIGGSSNLSFSWSTVEGNHDNNGAQMDLHLNGNPYVFSNVNFVNNAPGASQGFIWMDGTISYCAFEGCAFFNTSGSSFNMKGTAATWPSFANCLFDISASAINAASTTGCQFDLTATLTNTWKFISYSLCSDIVRTSGFTNEPLYSSLPNAFGIIFGVLMTND